MLDRIYKRLLRTLSTEALAEHGRWLDLDAWGNSTFLSADRRSSRARYLGYVHAEMREREMRKLEDGIAPLSLHEAKLYGRLVVRQTEEAISESPMRCLRPFGGQDLRTLARRLETHARLLRACAQRLEELGEEKGEG